MKRQRSFTVSTPKAKKPRLTKQQTFRRRSIATRSWLGIEKKFYDNGILAQAIVAPTDASGAELDPSATSMVSTPAQGDGEQNRDGKQIACLYLEMNAVINIPSVEDAANPVQPVAVYIAVVLDSQTNGAQLNSEDVFKNTAGNALTAASPLKNLLFGKRFRILKSQTFQFPMVQNTAEGDNLHSASGQQKLFKWFIPLRGMKINFNAGTTASIANVIDNSIHVIGYCTNVTLITPSLSYNSRLRFLG